MASPQLEKGYTRIAHEILEALARARLSGRELRIILLILRESYGRQRREATLSLRDIQDRTGIAYTHASQALSTMGVTKVVTVSPCYRNGNRSKSILIFQKDYHQWGVTKTVTVTKSGNGSVPKSVTVPRTRAGKRYRNRNTSSAPPVRSLIDFFFQKYQAALGERPVTFPGGALGKLFKAALKEHPAEEIERRISAWFESTDNFIRSNGYSPTMFVSKFALLKNGPILNGNGRPMAPKRELIT